MSGVRKRGEIIRNFILNSVSGHPSDIASITAKKFGISRQAANKHIKRLCALEDLSSEGNSRSKKYYLTREKILSGYYPLDGTVSEDKIWREVVSPLLKSLSDEATDIWHYGLTEMFNNAIDHSNGTIVGVNLFETAISYELSLFDDGEGIFKKITRVMNLDDERHAVLELAKGKFTTDPDNHTGEGIFFTSRVFDDFTIVAGGVLFSHDQGEEYDLIMESIGNTTQGTHISMQLSKKSKTDLEKVFDSFTSGEDKAFSKTIVPVNMAQYGDDKLVSRSQAKRVLVRIERFKLVMFDFEGVKSVGQAFADEIFRVFRNKNSEIEIDYFNANKQVKGMIQRALANRDLN